MQSSIITYQNILRGFSSQHTLHRHATSPLRVHRQEVKGTHHHRTHTRLAVALDDTHQASTSGRDSESDIEELTAEYIAHLQQEYSIDDLVTFSAGPGGMPIVTLRHPDGSRADISLHGGTVTSWQRPDGKELLYLRPDNKFDGQDPVRGGIELAWPQYGAGILPTHGFVRNLHWSVIETAATEDPADPKPTIILYACSEPSTEDVWPVEFEAVYSISLQGAPERELNPKEQAQEMDRVHAEIWEEALALQLSDEKVDELLAARAAAAENAEAAAALDVSLGGSSSAANGGGSGSQSERRPLDKGSPWKMYAEDTPSDVNVAGQSGSGESDDRIPTPSTMLRLNFQVINNSEEDMKFTAGFRQHLATEDISQNSKYVKVLGLGGKYVLDYSKDAMRPRMGVEAKDFIFFGEKDLVRVFVDSGKEGQVLMCPGTQTHFQIRNLEGVTDIAVEHPAVSAPQEARHHVIMTAARKACPVKLAPGDSWCADVALIQHDKYWDLPIFEREDPSTVPLPPREEALPPRRRNGMGGADAMLFAPDQE